MTTHLAHIDHLTLGETAGSYSLVLSPQATLSFDRAGRPLGLYEEGLYTARGLDGRCVEKKWVWDAAGDARARRHLRELSAPEQSHLKNRFLRLLSLCQESIPTLAQTGNLRHFLRGRENPSSESQTIALLNFLTEGVERAWSQDPAVFARIWKPIGILPPDQYLSLVIQVSEGCAWNRCSFCDFYSDRPARVRSREEIRRHADEAERFFGPALAGRCSLFLGDANAFEAPPEVLIAVAQELAERFPTLARVQPDGVGGLYSFAEATRLSAWTSSDLQALARTGYRRAYLGVETGWDSLRRDLRKPGTAETVSAGVLKLKSAGISVGIIVLLGAGGPDKAQEHVRETAAFLRALDLGRGDLLYFSPLLPSTKDTGPHGTEVDLALQRREIESLVPPRGERRALYDIREFVY